VTEWTSLLAVTPASPSAQPGSAEAKKIRGIYGRGSQMAFDFSGPSSVSLKTSKDISAWGCPTSSKTWQEWVIKQRGAYSQRLKSARLISGSGSSSWLTSSARDWKGCYTTLQRKDGKMRGDLLPDAVNIEEMHGPFVLASSSTDGSRPGLWQTPKSQDSESGKKISGAPNLIGQAKQWATPRTEHDLGAHRGKPDTLHSQIKSWPTPSSAGVTGGPTGLAGGAGNREKLAKMLTDAEARAMGCGKLNPRWVETLMGLPVGWTMPSCVSPVTIEPTSFDCSATESSQQQPSGPSEC
jgi:hypothetical protein